MDVSSFRSTGILLFPKLRYGLLALLFAGCGSDPSTNISIAINDPQRSGSFTPSDLSFGVAALDSSLCYAVHVTAEDLFVEKDSGSGSCADDSSPRGIGKLAGMYSFGATVKIAVKAGKARRFDLIGFRKTVREDLFESGQTSADPAPSNCPQNLRAQRTRVVDSQTGELREKTRLFAGDVEIDPQEIFLATGTSDLVPGDNTVTISLIRNSDGSIGKKYGGNCQSAAQAPAGLSYSHPSPSYFANTPITANVPTLSSGSADSYAVTPSLPTGLLLNATTGVISGTPSGQSSLATYTITATNELGDASTAITFEVGAAPPIIASINGNIDTAGASGQIVVDSGGNVFYGAVNSWMIRKVTPGGAQSDFAGGFTGNHTDGTGLSAGLLQPTHLAINSLDNIYVADGFKVRKIDPSGVVTTVGQMDSGGTQHSIAADASGNVYFVFDNGTSSAHKIQKMDSAGNVTLLAGDTVGDADGTGVSARFNNPRGLAVDSFGNVYVADVGNFKIKKITPVGVVTTLAGNGAAGIVDATGASARFSFSTGYANLVIDLATNDLFVGDISWAPSVSVIRKINTTSGEVTSVCGTGSGVAGSCGTTSLYSNFGLAFGGPSNSVYVVTPPELLKISF